MPAIDDYLESFDKICHTKCLNGRLKFVEMQVSLNFANTLGNMIKENYEQRITHLNLQRNNLGDSGAIILMNAVMHSKVLIYLNFASNNIGPLGLDTIFKGLMINQSITHVDVSTYDGYNRNRVSSKNSKAI